MFGKQLKGLGHREKNRAENTNLGVFGMGMAVEAKGVHEISSEEMEKSKRPSTQPERQKRKQGE